MSLTARPYVFAADYPEICEWWRAREREGWTYIPPEKLPATGFVVEGADGVKHGVVFVYLCEAGWAWVEWLTTNPKAPLKSRKAAVEKLVETAVAFCREAGRTSALSSLRNENLIRVFEKFGFRSGEGGMTDMIWNANQ